MNDHLYRGHTISLVLSMVGSMWTCQYVIKKAGKEQMDGFPDGETYESREQAEAAALAKAKDLIDTAQLSKEPQMG